MKENEIAPTHEPSKKASLNDEKNDSDSSDGIIGYKKRKTNALQYQSQA